MIRTKVRVIQSRAKPKQRRNDDCDDYDNANDDDCNCDDNSDNVKGHSVPDNNFHHD